MQVMQKFVPCCVLIPADAESSRQELKTLVEVRQLDFWLCEPWYVESQFSLYYPCDNLILCRILKPLLVDAFPLRAGKQQMHPS